MAADPIESDDLDALRAEIRRLRDLVGPSEDSYQQLKLDLLGARDAAIGATASAGAQRGRVIELESELQRTRHLNGLVLRTIAPAAKGLRGVMRAVRASANT